MRKTETFTILSSGASLIEVKGQGPYANLLGGISVADGVPLTAPVSLLRVWRVDAPPSIQATITITNTPFGLGALTQVRRCVPLTMRIRWIAAWPRLAAFLRCWVSWLYALWNLYTDIVPKCEWTNIGDSDGTTVNAQGGDLVVVTFVSP
jgi:hypothetical protein